MAGSVQQNHCLRPGWCHCICGTYGSWLPGDPRGFRTRGHREHVDGDYKNPPERDYAVRHQRAQSAMNRPGVTLTPEARQVVVEAVVHALCDVHGLELVALAVSPRHMHLLARFPAHLPTPARRGLRETDPVRHVIGIAKERSAKGLRDRGLVTPGGAWARKGKIVRVTSRDHQVRVYHYILRHQREGAAVWSRRESQIQQA